MKILLFTPTYKLADGSLAFWRESREAIANLNYGAHQVTPWVRIASSQNNQDVVVHYQKAQKRFLKEKFDALMIVEHDNIVPPDALIKLANANKPVIYGTYLFRRGTPVLNALRHVDTWIVDQSLQFFPAELEKARKAVIYPVSGLGFGCIFIQREVLEKITFHATPDNFYPDGPFAADCCKARIPQFAHFGVECGHIKDDGAVLWPSLNPAQYNACECRVNQTFNGNVNGDSRHFEAGKIASIPIECAEQFERAGYVSILSQTPLAQNGRIAQAHR